MLLRSKVYPSKSDSVTLLVVMILAIIITACLIILPGPGSELSSFYSNWTTNISALVAISLSSLTTIRAYRTSKIPVIDNANDEVGEGDLESDPMQYRRTPRRFQFYTCLSLTIGLTLDFG